MQSVNDSREHSGFSNEFRAQNFIYDGMNQVSIDTNALQMKNSFARHTSSCSKRLCEILRTVFPISLSLILEMLIDLTNIYFAGHLGSYKYLSATGLAIAISNILGVASMFGLSSALDTLGSLSFGCQKFQKTGIYFNQARIILFLACILIVMPLYMLMGLILKAVGVEQELAQLTGVYLRILFPAILLHIQATVVRKFFRIQRIGWVHFAVIGFTLPFHMAGLYILIKILDFGFETIPAWTIATHSISFIGMNFYLYCCDIVQMETIVKFSSEDMKGWQKFIKEGFPQMVVVCLQWWSFQITTVALAFLSGLYLGAHIILVSIGGVIYILSAFGFSVTSSSLVGTAMSLGDINKAKQLATQITIYSILVNAFLVLMCYFLSSPLINFMVQDDQIRKLAKEIVDILLIENIVEVFGGVLSGVLRGIGREKRSLMTMLMLFYFFFQPLSIVLAYNGYFLYGIWWTLIATTAMVSLSNLMMVVCTDWKQAQGQIRKATLQEQEEPLLSN